MKVFIDYYEGTCCLAAQAGTEVEVSEDTLAKWEETLLNFEEMQEEMRRLIGRY